VSDTTQLLSQCTILSGVNPKLRRQIAEAGEHRRLAASEVLIAQGDSGGTLFFLLAGTLEVRLDDAESETIAVIETGETVGELSVLDGSRASAFVVAPAEAEVLAVDESAFWLLINESHSFAINLLLKLVERLRANNATVSESVQKRHLYERAAMFDGLTGVHNRRWLDDTLHRLVERSTRDGAGLCLALIDIDHFKLFNDTHGHDAGDLVLSTVASLLSANLRPTDQVARFGGEEFVVLFPNASLEEAFDAAERVREVVATASLVSPAGDELPPVTFSAGLAVLNGQQDPAGLLKAADRAMYAAKSAGRNQVCLADN